MPPPKRPTKPSMSAVVMPVGEDTDPGSGRHRACLPGRTAYAMAEQLAERLDDHVTTDNEQLGILRTEVADVRGEIHEVRGEVKEINNRVGDLRVSMAKMTATVDNISAALVEQKEIRHVRMVAEVETGKAAQIATIEDAADGRKARRAFWLKVGVAVVTVVSTLLGMLIEHYR